MTRRWEKSTRYYLAHLQRDLFGGWVVTKVWGGKNSRLGQIRDQPVDSEAAGIELMAAIGRRRAQRGYTLIAERNA